MAAAARPRAADALMTDQTAMELCARAFFMQKHYMFDDAIYLAELALAQVRTACAHAPLACPSCRAPE